MSSSSHHKNQHHVLVPLGTKKITTTRTIEDAMKKLTITDEKIYKNKLASDHKGRVELKQEVVNRRTETAKDRRTGTVKRVTYEEVSKNGVALGREEKGKIKERSHLETEKKHGSHHHHHHHHERREVVKYESKHK